MRLSQDEQEFGDAAFWAVFDCLASVELIDGGAIAADPGVLRVVAYQAPADAGRAFSSDFPLLN